MLYFLKTMSQTKLVFWLIQVPNMSKHISRNRGPTIKASQKTAHNKDFLFWGKMDIFSKINGGTIKTKVIALNLYIGTNVLVYERWLVLKVWCMAGRATFSPLHKLTLLMHVSKKITKNSNIKIY